jgi:hypothetical protein
MACAGIFVGHWYQQRPGYCTTRRPAAGLLDPAPRPMRFSRADQPNTPYITDPAPIPPLPARSCLDWA